MKRSITAATMFALLASAAPARADDTEKVALLSFLGLKAAEGKTEVGEKGGELESWIAAGGLMANAACLIAKSVSDALPQAGCIEIKNSGAKLLILGDSEQLDVGSYALVTSRTAYVTSQLTAAKCKPGKAPTFGAEATGLEAVDGSSAVAAVIGLAKSDTKVSGIALDLKERTFINALAGTLGPRAILPDGIAYNANSKLDGNWNAAVGLAAALAVGPCKDQAQAKAALAIFDDAKKTLFESGDKGSPFDRARAAEPLVTAGSVPDIVRVRVEYTGATLINRQNIFTTLGAPALSLSGGMVVSYRMTNSADGATKKAGIVVCRAGVKLLHTFNDPQRPVSGGTCTLS